MKRLADIVGRISVAPFEFFIGLVVIVSGSSALVKLAVPDPVNILLPQWEVYLSSLILVISGLCIIVGIVLGNIAAEALGLISLCGSLIARLILYDLYLGADVSFYISGALDTAFIFAASIRLAVIRKVHIVIHIGKAGGDANLDDNSGPSNTARR